jgi:hypothetical protein
MKHHMALCGEAGNIQAEICFTLDSAKLFSLMESYVSRNIANDDKKGKVPLLH